MFLLTAAFLDIRDRMLEICPVAGVFAHAVQANDERTELLRDNLLDLNERANSIRARADSEQRDLTDEEAEEIDRILVDFERTEEEIKRRERIAAASNRLSQSAGRQVPPNDPEPQNVAHGMRDKRVPRNVEINDRNRGNHGFRSFGEFAQAVRIAASNGGGGYRDPRLLVNAPTTHSSEGVGADGGFAVPPDFRAAIMEKVMGEESLLSRTDQLESGSNTIVLPVDETTPWQTSGGIQVYWEGENSQMSQSKVALGTNTIRLNKLTALVPVTEELLSDAPALDAYLRRKTPEKMDFAVNDAIINGTGVGKPLGILNAGCTVSIAKETSQAADTLLAENVIKMWSRMYGPSRSRAVWLINQDIEPQLFTMSIKIKNVAGAENVGGMPVYMPPNGLSQSPYGTLLGRPIIPTQACQTLGDKGDIIFADLSQYMTAVKTGGLRTDVSIHLWFDYDTLAYRFILRIAGQPWWSSSISPKNGSNTLSPFVTLDERAG
jgi:HK97 family phage major capsid protein